MRRQRRAVAQLRRRLGALGPQPHGGVAAAKRDHRMHGACGLDVQRKPRAPDRTGLFDLGVFLGVALDLELRHGRALRRGEGNLERPARMLAALALLHGRLRHRGDLEQRLTRDGGVGLLEQTVPHDQRRVIRCQRRRGDDLRRRIGATERRRRNVRGGAGLRRGLHACGERRTRRVAVGR